VKVREVYVLSFLAFGVIQNALELAVEIGVGFVDFQESML
jgi:hypothetical protein